MRNNQEYDTLRAMYDRDLAEHELIPLVEGPVVFAYRMKRPGTRNYLVELIFTNEGILMHGDFTPPRSRGPCGTHGYRLDWFIGDLDKSYLAEKFLQKQWTADEAESHVRHNIEMMRDAITYDNVTEWRVEEYRDGRRSWRAVERDELLDKCYDLEQKANDSDGFSSAVDYVREWEPEFEGSGRDSEWVYPDNAYDLGEVAALVAIHARFRQLYLARQARSASELREEGSAI